MWPGSEAGRSDPWLHTWCLILVGSVVSPALLSPSALLLRLRSALCSVGQAAQCNSFLRPPPLGNEPGHQTQMCPCQQHLPGSPWPKGQWIGSDMVVNVNKSWRWWSDGDDDSSPEPGPGELQLQHQHRHRRGQWRAGGGHPGLRAHRGHGRLCLTGEMLSHVESSLRLNLMLSRIIDR